MIGDLATATLDEILELGYVAAKRIARDLWVGVGPVICGAGLYVIEDRYGWKQMWFYQNEWTAIAALDQIPSDWDGQSSDPPGMWIKSKPSQRLGPGWDRSAVQCTFSLSFGHGSDGAEAGMFANSHEATAEAERVCGVIFEPESLLRLDRERNRIETAWVTTPKTERWARIERRDVGK